MPRPTPMLPGFALAAATAVATAIGPRETASAQNRTDARPPGPSRPSRAEPKPLATVVPFPHPLITEILFAVPDGAAGDASRDGVRSATGDEFIELVNPHKRPISLKGYTITDTPRAQGQNGPAKGGGGGGAVSYVFGEITLAPGQVVVVFNGYRGEGDESVGSPQPLAPPPTANPASGPAGSRPRAAKRPPPPIVLAIKPRSPYAALSNEGESVVLIDPRGMPVQAIAWGDHDDDRASDVEKNAPIREQAADVRPGGSIARRGLSRGLLAHAEIPAHAGAPFSPGAFEPDANAPAPNAAPISAPANPPTPPVPSEDPAPAQREPEPEPEPAAPAPRPSGPEPAGPQPRERE